VNNKEVSSCLSSVT